MLKKVAFSLLSVFLLMDLAIACPAGLRAFDKQLDGQDTCVLEGTYAGSVRLESGFNYILLGAVYIGNEKREENTDMKEGEVIEPGQLIVSPGVKIYALNPKSDTTGLWAGSVDENGQPIIAGTDVKSFLTITRDSTIQVSGSEAAPVLMTSANGAHLVNPGPVKKPGDWGGLVIHGKAKSNKCGDFANCTLPGEAGTGWYGGDNDEHSSGSIEYLQVEYGGDKINGIKELNGITFNSVGLGTKIENIAVLYNNDDCIEFFGGAATARNIFCYKGEDDGIDTTDGARVFLQNGIVVARDYPEAGDDNERHMVEADSSKADANNLKLRSHPVLTNFTFVGALNSLGFMIRRGTDYSMYNSVMLNVDLWCMDPTGANTLTFSSNLFSGCSSQDPIASLVGNVFPDSASLMLQGLVPMENSPLLSGAEIIEEFLPSDLDIDEAFYEVYREVNYRGAIGDVDWTSWIQLRD